MREQLIFEHSRPGRSAEAQYPLDAPAPSLPEHLRRRSTPLLPEVSELQAVRHFTRLSQLNFSIDTHFYPLGSCTMKYNRARVTSTRCCRGSWAAIRSRPSRPGRASSSACTSSRRCSRK